MLIHANTVRKFSVILALSLSTLLAAACGTLVGAGVGAAGGAAVGAATAIVVGLVAVRPGPVVHDLGGDRGVELGPEAPPGHERLRAAVGLGDPGPARRRSRSAPTMPMKVRPMSDAKTTSMPNGMLDARRS